MELTDDVRAHHEAGHCILLRHHGKAIVDVTLERTLVAGWNKGEEEVAFQVFMAGSLAAIEYRRELPGHFLLNGGEGDYIAMQGIIRNINEEIRLKQRKYEIELGILLDFDAVFYGRMLVVSKILLREWKKVEAVAKVLLERRILTGAEVEAAVSTCLENCT